MFQLAYVTAQTLGIADRTHEAMFDAVWTTGELATTDAASGAQVAHADDRGRRALLSEANRRAGGEVSGDRRSRSASIRQVRHDEDLIKAYGVDRTPTSSSTASIA